LSIVTVPVRTGTKVTEIEDTVKETKIKCMEWPLVRTDTGGT
jgi:hypothetical protein